MKSLSPSSPVGPSAKCLSFPSIFLMSSAFSPPYYQVQLTWKLKRLTQALCKASNPLSTLQPV